MRFAIRSPPSPARSRCWPRIATLTEDQRALVEQPSPESERLNGIIGDFLTYSRDREVQSATVDLCQLLSDTLTLLENRQSNIRIERNFAQPRLSPKAMGTS